MIKRSKLCGLLGALAWPARSRPDQGRRHRAAGLGGARQPCAVLRGARQGLFRRAGIDAGTIRKGTGSTDALRLVANGNADFGSDLPTLMVGRSQGIANTALVAVNQKTPLAIISVKKHFDLKSVQQLKGANIGVHPAGSTTSS